jgi:hypothetical protein
VIGLTSYRFILAACAAAAAMMGASLGHAAYSDKTWNNTGSANWNVAANWSPSGVPASSVSLRLIFGNAIAAPSTVTNNTTTGSFNIGQIQFDSAQPYRVEFTANAASNGTLAFNDTNTAILLTVIPEPGALALLAAGSLLIASRGRQLRDRKQA